MARGDCGKYLQVVYDQRKHGRIRKYRCTCSEICSSCPADELDLYVQSMIDGALVTEEFQEAIAARQADDANAVAARAEVARLKAELVELRTRYKDRRLTLDEYQDFRDDTAAQLRTAQDRLAASSPVPAVVSGEVEWWDLPAARKAVAALVDIRIHPVGKGRRVPIEERVTITPRYGR